MARLLETFYEDQSNGLHTETHKRTSTYNGTWIEFFVSTFEHLLASQGVIKSEYNFYMRKNIFLVEYGLKSIHDLICVKCSGTLVDMNVNFGNVFQVV